MKRILHDFVIDKIAAVDRPCQEHATVTITKRADPAEQELAKADAAFEAASLTSLKLKLALQKARDAAVSDAQRSVLKLSLDLLGSDVQKAWGDEARAASLEARRGGGKKGTKSGVVEVDRLTPLTQAQKDHNYFLMHGKKPPKK